MNTSKTASPKEQGRRPTIIRHILFPTDFSSTAHNAFIFALHFAEQLNAKITLLNVYEDITSIDGKAAIKAPPALIKSLAADREEEALRAFEEYQREALMEIDKVVEIDIRLQKGNPRKLIAQVGEEIGCDLIIMGTQGASSQNEQILGSITTHVIHHALCPVMAIPAEASYKPIEYIMYCNQMTEEEFVTLEHVSVIADQLDAYILCTHIQAKEDYWKKVEMESFQKLFKLEEGGRFTFYFMNNDNVVQGLQHFVTQNHVDMVAMATHRREEMNKFINESLTREMVLYTDVPLIAFHS